jgi:formate hydrogenlyase subunit 3/multisubunit Na+/H+ antiporter MnhD subunit
MKGDEFLNTAVYLLFILIFPFLGAFIGYYFGRKSEKSRDALNILITGITFVVVTALYKTVVVSPIEISVPHIMGTGLHLKLDVFRYIFVFITSLVWFLTTIYSTQYLISYKNRNRYYLFYMLTLGSTIGIFISENFLNLFTFFEIMSFTSYALIIHDEDDYSHDAGDTYIAMAVGGGLILLMGLFLLYNYTQTLDIGELYTAVNGVGSMKYVISILIIIGFGVKAGMFPLHVWLPKAHPAAPAPASAILSGILLKTGIFGVLITTEVILKGDFIVSSVILVIGFINMFVGGLLAIFQRNIKRILAYSSMSQIGYILVGIGLMGILKDHNGAAIYGTLYHIINHAIFKVLLFMGAGIIYMVLHELSINKIGGFGRHKNLLKIVFLIGLCAIIGMPGFNGFISKTLLHHALSEAHHIYGGMWFTIGKIIFTISSCFTVAYLLKIFVAVFIEEGNSNIEKVKVKINKRALFPLAVLAGIIIYIGIKPSVVLHVLDYATAPFGEVHHIEEQFYTFKNIKSSLITIFLGGLIYLGFVRGVLRKGKGKNWVYVNPALNWINLERNVYKPVFKVVFFIISTILKIVDCALISSVTFISNVFKGFGKIEIHMYESLRGNIKNMAALIFNIKRNETGGRFQNNDSSQEPYFTLNAREKMGQIVHKMNSVTYSIFIFGIFLVVCLAVLIY